MQTWSVAGRRAQAGRPCSSRGGPGCARRWADRTAPLPASSPGHRPVRRLRLSPPAAGRPAAAAEGALVSARSRGPAGRAARSGSGRRTRGTGPAPAEATEGVQAGPASPAPGRASGEAGERGRRLASAVTRPRPAVRAGFPTGRAAPLSAPRLPSRWSVCLPSVCLSAYLPFHCTKTPGKMKENHNRNKPKNKDF